VCSKKTVAKVMSYTFWVTKLATITEDARFVSDSSEWLLLPVIEGCGSTCMTLAVRHSCHVIVPLVKMLFSWEVPPGGRGDLSLLTSLPLQSFVLFILITIWH
jgi:hypothetical protein